MGEDKVSAFYDDPVKQACDAWSAAKGRDFRRITIDSGLYWRSQAWPALSVGEPEDSCGK